MSEKPIDDGGPAFPVHLDDFRDAVGHPLPGMSLRDWFAGMALTNAFTHEDALTDKVAGWAYELADAMLAERAKREPDCNEATKQATQP